MTNRDLDRRDTISQLTDIFAQRGAEAYLGEAVTVAEHMLQAATLAQTEGAPDALVAAALLHDIGHLTSELGEYSPEDSVDKRHDAAGAKTLEGFFPAEVVECVRLHVAAKRYLCATDRSYYGKLSEPSKHSLVLQGGPMSETEVARFRSLEFHQEAVRVRLWDDAAKVVGLQIPTFDEFRALLQRVIDRRR